MRFKKNYRKADFQTPEYKQFRKDVLRRDGWKCRWPGCGSKIRLQVHHIITFASNFLLRLNVNNGITLCRCCHDKIKGKEASYVELFLNIIFK
jgi:5-methylcytosine-specific restriction endonuclease McrA